MTTMTTTKPVVTVIRRPRGGGSVAMTEADGRAIQIRFDYWETARMELFVAMLNAMAAPKPPRQRKPRGKSAVA